MSPEIKKTLIDVFKYMLIALLPMALACFLLFKAPMPYILGLLFGSLISFLGFVELALTMTKAVKMSARRAGLYVNAKYHLRLILFGIAIFVSIKAPHLNVYATVVGLLLVKLIIYITNIFVSKKSVRKEE